MSHDPIEDALLRVRSLEWEGGEAVSRVADRLAASHSAPPRRTRRTHFIALGAVACLILGGAVAATVAVIENARLYDITISEGGEVKASPRIITAPGQAASLTVTHEDGSQTTVDIDERGDVSVRADREDTEVEVDVIEPPPAPRRMYHVVITAEGRIVASPSVLVAEGESAEVTISGGADGEIRIVIDGAGKVHVTGIDAESVEVTVEEVGAPPR